MEQQSYLSDLEFNPVLAGAGQRFLNYLIDVIVFLLFLIVISLVVLEVNQPFYLRMVYNDSSANQLLHRLLVTVLFVMYYSFLETVFKGRTIGKFITGTKAVNEDGTEMQSKTIWLRSLSRVVPFEPLSAFGGHPWHDKWTKTYVIDVKKTTFNTTPDIS